MIKKRWKPEAWAKAYQRAQLELKMPARGKVGSKANRDRQRIAPLVHHRAQEILLRGLIALLLVTAPARADHKPWFKNPEWWARHAVIVGALAADGVTTCDSFARGYVEQNSLARGNHSCRATGFQLAGAFAFYETLNWASVRVMRDDPSPRWRFASRWSMPAVVAGVHGQAAAHNARLP